MMLLGWDAEVEDEGDVGEIEQGYREGRVKDELMPSHERSE